MALRAHSGATVTVTNITTSDILTDTTNASGEYTVDAANFTNGYSDGDYLTVVCDYGSTGVAIDSDEYGHRLNIQEDRPAVSTHTAVWSLGESKIAQTDDYWSYGESGRYRTLGGATAGTFISTPSLAVMLDAGLL